MPFRAVLLDWGGTVVHDDTLRPAAVAAAVVAALPARSDVSAERFAAAFAQASPPSLTGETIPTPEIESLIARALQSLGLSPTPETLERALVAFADAHAAGQRVFDDARALLSSLRYRGYRTAVVTNTPFPARLFSRRLGPLGLRGYFDAVVCSADVGFGKPHPAPYLAALDALAVPASRALFVGDRPETDIAGAHAAALTAVRIDRSLAAPHFEAGIVHRLTALEHWLGHGPARP